MWPDVARDCIHDRRFLFSSKGQARSVVYQRGLIDSAPFLNAFKMVGGLFPIRSGNMKAVGRRRGKRGVVAEMGMEWRRWSGEHDCANRGRGREGRKQMEMQS